MTPSTARPILRVATVVTKFTAGAGLVALQGAVALPRSRWDVTIFTAAGGSLAVDARAAGLRVVELDHMSPEIDPFDDVSGVRELASWLRQGGYDLVHTHSTKAGAMGRLAARRAGIAATVHTLHGFPFHEFQSRLRRSIYVAAERRLGRITSHFLAVGADTAVRAIRLGIASPERITVVSSARRTGIVPCSPVSRARARQLLGLPLGARVVGTVGRLAFQKAPEELVEAAAVLDRPDVHYVWVGGGPDRREVESLAARRGVRARFLFVGERLDVAQLLPAFDVFALPSRYEGVPCAVAEAMACGLPVVATAVNAVSDIVVPGRTGLLVRVGDRQQLARSIAFLLDHPDEATRMAAAGRDLVLSRFDGHSHHSQLVPIYERVLGTKGIIDQHEPPMVMATARSRVEKERAAR